MSWERSFERLAKEGIAAIEIMNSIEIGREKTG
jgi:hypothetical protein